jgi:DNA-binding CsgD family transcriptional regulator
MAAVLVQEKSYYESVNGDRRKIFFVAFLAIILSVMGAYVVSRYYLKPVLSALNNMRNKRLSDIEKTNIPEIDDLLGYLAKQDKRKNSGLYNSDLFLAFLENIKTLSPAEKAVFDLYMEGHTAREITDILFLSINTIKTHNRRIYEKLNVSSRKELMVYINMMEEMNNNKTN